MISNVFTLQKPLAGRKLFVNVFGYIKRVHRPIIDHNHHIAFAHLLGQSFFYNNADNLGLVRLANIKIDGDAFILL